MDEGVGWRYSDVIHLLSTHRHGDDRVFEGGEESVCDVIDAIAVFESENELVVAGEQFQARRLVPGVVGTRFMTASRK